MAAQASPQSKSNVMGSRITQYLPFLDWLLHYRRENLSGDIVAGVIVAVMLVPQSMAYALLAGLPPEVGIYASILPLFIYGLLGSSRVLAVGPVAIVSLMVAAGVGQFQPANTSEYLQLSITLTLLVGAISLGLGLLRVGFLVNFLSHPVLAGFMNAAAIVIAISQLKHLLGISMPRFDHTHESVLYIVENLNEVNASTVIVSLVAVVVLVASRRWLGDILRDLGVPDMMAAALGRSGPLFAVLIGIFAVLLFDLSATVAIVGTIPAGLPSLTMPSFDVSLWQRLLPIAAAIALIGYMESISVAKSLASKKRQKVDPNQELVALGAANLGAAFTGGYPVAGGIGRSVVNFSAGANTGLASLITAGLMALTVLVLTPLFYYLPQAVLAAIIVVAVTGFLDTSVFMSTWRYSKSDAISLLITFGAVLFIGVETGILLGVAVGLALYLWRTSQPHVAVVGRVGNTEHFRNVLRHDVTTYPHILAIRVDESLYFPNAQYLESVLLSAVADDPEIDHLVLVCSAVNYVDTSALDVLKALVDELRDSGVSFHMAEVKGPVMDKLIRAGFVDHLGPDHFFLSTHVAITTLSDMGSAPEQATYDSQVVPG
ncbi:MAG: SulP family inorganic anion transporter [Chloroflexota bacterium]